MSLHTTLLIVLLVPIVISPLLRERERRSDAAPKKFKLLGASDRFLFRWEISIASRIRA